MRNYIIEQLRKNSCVKGKQQTWVSTLTGDQLYELFLKFRNGESAKSIAGYIQKAWEVNPKSSQHSVSIGLTKFKKRIAHLLLQPTVESSGGNTCEGYNENDTVGSSERMETITHLQLDRICRMIAEERETGIRLAGMSRELHALSGLIKALLKAKEWDRINQGLDPVKRIKLDRMRRHAAKQFDNLMGDLSEGGKDAILEWVEKFLTMAEESAVTLSERKDEKSPLNKEKITED